MFEMNDFLGYDTVCIAKNCHLATTVRTLNLTCLK
jgi:hypothetical protein